MDVCQNDGNLISSGGADKRVKIYDRRESKIVKTFAEIELSKKFYALFSINNKYFASAVTMCMHIICNWT